MLSPLHVEVVNADTLVTKVGPQGKQYDLKFTDVMNLIRNRQGAGPRLLEYKK